MTVSAWERTRQPITRKEVVVEVEHPRIREPAIEADEVKHQCCPALQLENIPAQTTELPGLAYLALWE